MDSGSRRTYVTKTLPGLVKRMGATGKSFNESGNGVWMKGGKIGGSSWHMGAIGQSITGGFVKSPIKNRKDFQISNTKKMKSPGGKFKASSKSLKSARKQSAALARSGKV